MRSERNVVVATLLEHGTREGGLPFFLCDRFMTFSYRRNVRVETLRRIVRVHEPPSKAGSLATLMTTWGAFSAG
ncbi:MAG: hypothetical protein DLM70_16835 [Chloroflexi bacterium]|nr:MAG: hypothetical protein DLM70_16835 [Chloroflexota bacterium]